LISYTQKVFSICSIS